MDNSQFLNVLKNSFLKYLETDSRSDKKLKILHGAIAEDLFSKLQESSDTNDNYSICSLGFGKCKEIEISGRYIDKKVDIVVTKNDIPVTGIAVKYVMRNYKQNSNNYFENMLGETANIRSNRIPYFQILIIPDKLPYFDKNRIIKKWEIIDEKNLKKYIVMSKDNIEAYLHTPNKTLVFIVNISENEECSLSDKDWDYYKNYYETMPFLISTSSKKFDFGSNIVYNNYEEFIKKVVYSILSL